MVPARYPYFWSLLYAGAPYIGRYIGRYIGLERVWGIGLMTVFWLHQQCDWFFQVVFAYEIGLRYIGRSQNLVTKIGNIGDLRGSQWVNIGHNNDINWSQWDENIWKHFARAIKRKLAFWCKFIFQKIRPCKHEIWNRNKVFKRV